MTARVERRIRNRLRRNSQRKQRGWEGLLGDGHGNVEVPGQPDYWYVRPRGSDLPGVVRRGSAPELEGLHVWVGPDPYMRNQVRIMGVIGNNGSQVSSVESHAPTHREDGTDPVYITDRQITPLLCYASSGMAVHFNAGYIVYNGAAFKLESDDLSLTASVPASGARYSLIRVNNSGTIDVQDGNLAASYTDLSDDDIPAAPAGFAPLAFARLYAGQTALSRLTANPDIKPLIWGNGLYGREASGNLAIQEQEFDLALTMHVLGK